MQHTYNVYARNNDKYLLRIVASKCYDHEDAINFVTEQLKQTNVYYDKLAVLAVINGGAN